MSKTDYTDKQILEARHELWRMGELDWKLDPVQLGFVDFIRKSKRKSVVLNISRRVGKSYALTILATEQCLKHPKSIVKFLQPEQKMVRMNVAPIMDKILVDCPAEIKPRFMTKDSVWKFPNGSEIQLAGTDNGNHEKLRGGDAHLCLVDEAGFVKDKLQYIIRSVLLPTTLLTRGKIILSSTTPPEADHEFIKYMESAEQRKTLYKLNLYEALKIHKTLDNPRFTDEIVDEIIEEYPGGAASDDFRRECLNEIITDGSNNVIPEFTEEIQKDIVMEWIRPPFCHKYVSMDIGVRDMTAILFGYYDFMNGVTVIEDEIILRGHEVLTEHIANLIREKEAKLWTDSMTGEQDRPRLRVCDNNNLILVNDLQYYHQLTFMPTQKDNKDAQVNKLRMDIRDRKIIINPRCETLIQHLKYATWNKNRKEFSRSPDNGHYDACDSLIYLIRNIDKSANPYPPGYRFQKMGRGSDIFINPFHQKDEDKYNKFKEIFQPKKINKINKY